MPKKHSSQKRVDRPRLGPELGAILAALPHAAALYEAEAPFRCVQHNAAFAELVAMPGSDRLTMAGMALGNVFAPSAAARLEHAFHMVCTTSSSLHISAPIPEFAAPEAAQWSISPLRDEQGRVVQLLISVLSALPLQTLLSELQASEARFRAIAETVPDIVFLSDSTGACHFINGRFSEYTGLPATEVLGFGWGAAIHPDDQAGMQAKWAIASRTNSPYEQELRLQMADGSYRWFMSRSIPVLTANDEVSMWIGSTTDVDAIKRAEQALRFLREASTLLVSSLDYDMTLQQVAQLAVPRLADWFGVYVPLDNGSIKLIAGSHCDPDRTPLLYEFNRRYPAHINDPVGLGLVLRTGQSKHLPHISLETMRLHSQDSEQLALLEQLGVSQTMLVPLLARGRTLGVLCFAAATTARQFSADDLRLAEELGSITALAMDNAQLYQETQQHALRAQTLVVATQLFAEASLDLQTLLDRVTTKVATLVGDLCTIRFLSHDDTRLDTVAFAHPDPEAARLVGPLLQASSESTTEGLTPTLLATGQPVLVAEMPLEAMHPSVTTHLQPYLDRYGVRSVLLVPLRARGRVFGVLGLSRQRDRPIYTANDATFVADLADRAALAIDNARLYAAEQQARQAAERAMARTLILQSVTAALSMPHSQAEIADLVLSQGMVGIGAIAGALSLLHGDGTYEIVRMLGYPEHVAQTWLGRRYLPTIGAPIPDAVQNKTPIWIESLAAMELRYPHWVAQLSELQCRSCATVPLLAEDQAFGGFTFLFSSAGPFDPADQSFLLSIGQQCAQAIQRVRLHEAAQRGLAATEAAAQRARLLSDASNVLAGSLDEHTLLDRFMRLLVPRFAEYTIVYQASAEGSIHQTGLLHVDPTREQLLRELLPFFTLDPAGAHPAAVAIKSRQTMFYPALPGMQAALIDQLLTDPALLPKVQALLPTLQLIVPLIARQQVLGAIVFGLDDLSRSYDDADVGLAEELANRASLALDNARLYHEAQEAVRLRDIFFSIAAHELKTPLTTLLGQVQLFQRRAQREQHLNQRDHHTITVIGDQAQRLNHLLGTMLDIARIEQGKLSIERQVLDLDALIRRIIEELRPTLERHTLRYPEAGMALLINGDALRLEQVVQNLISNAVKYSPDGGVVELWLEQQAEMVCFSVRDQGIGIPSSALPQLFQRFYRASNADARYISGMGIGLALVKEIVTLHDGLVHVESVEGQGSTFQVVLPLHQPATAQAILAAL